MRAVLATAVLIAAAPVAADWPARWTVVTGGRTGTLELKVTSAGHASGRVLEAPFVGTVVGDRLVMTTSGDEGALVWTALVGVGPDDEAFLAGTVDDGVTVEPWYAVAAPDPTAEPVPPAEAPVVEPDVEAVEPTAPAPPSDSEPSAEADPPATPSVTAPPPMVRNQLADLDGRWQTPAGSVEIRQDNRKLEVVFAGGEVRRGRMTGNLSFVVGLRPACCRGELTGVGLISWDDGTFWQRLD